MNRFLLLALALPVAVFCGSCTDGSESTARENAACYWYNSDTCCTEAKSTGLNYNYTVPPCGKLSEGCEDYTLLAFCGLYCKPDISNFLTDDDDYSSVRVCSTFAKNWYEACLTDNFQDPLTHDCVYVNSTFPGYDGFVYWASAGKLTYSSKNDETCFNSATITNPTFILFALMLFISTFLFI